jgi:hypothetical protein
LERLRAERNATAVRLEQLTAAIEAAERIVPELIESSASQTETAPAVKPPKAADTESAETATSGFVVVPRREAVSLVRNASLRRRLHGLTHHDALVTIAKDNDGTLSVADAVEKFIDAGLTRSKPRDVYGAIHTMLRKSDRFEKGDPGQFRLVPVPEPTHEQPALANGWRATHNADS